MSAHLVQEAQALDDATIQISKLRFGQPVDIDHGVRHFNGTGWHSLYRGVRRRNVSERTLPWERSAQGHLSVWLTGGPARRRRNKKAPVSSARSLYESDDDVL